MGRFGSAHITGKVECSLTALTFLLWEKFQLEISLDPELCHREGSGDVDKVKVILLTLFNVSKLIFFGFNGALEFSTENLDFHKGSFICE